MNLQITDEFINICQEIASKKLSIDEWKLIESCDMFQSLNFCGGFDEIEDAFCFSYYDEKGKEFWFDISLSDVEKIVNGFKVSILLRDAI
jgi:hypothetical protein